MTTRPLSKTETQSVVRLARRAIEEKGINLPLDYQQRIADNLSLLRDKLKSGKTHRIEIAEDRNNRLTLEVTCDGRGYFESIGKRLPWALPSGLSETFSAPEHFQKMVFREVLPLLPTGRVSKSRLAQSYYEGNLPALVQQVEKSLSGPPRIAAHLLILIHLIHPSALEAASSEQHFKDQYELYQKCRLFHELNIFENTCLFVETSL